MGEVKTLDFQLPEKTVIVKYIKRRKGMASGDHIGEDHIISGGMLETATKRFTPKRLRNGSYANVLTNVEKEYLEGVTGLNLSIYSEFWENQTVSLRKQDNIFDLSKPADYIAYKILLTNNDRIVVGLENRDKSLMYEFVVTEQGEDLKLDKKKFDIVKLAWKEYAKIETDREKLIGVLRLLQSTMIAYNSQLEWLQGKVEKIVSEKPKDFLSLVTDKTFDTKILINNAIDAGIIVKTGNKYFTVDGVELWMQGQNSSFDTTVDFLENIKNQDIRSLIEAKLNNSKD